MTDLLKTEFKFLAKPLNFASRLVLLAGVMLIMASYWFPLWQIHLVAPQYRDGLNLDIHSWRIVAGNHGHDIEEINNLNHYIGMKPLQQADFFEMKFMPFVLGGFVIFTLRAGRVRHDELCHRSLRAVHLLRRVLSRVIRVSDV